MSSPSLLTSQPMPMTTAQLAAVSFLASRFAGELPFRPNDTNHAWVLDLQGGHQGDPQERESAIPIPSLDTDGHRVFSQSTREARPRLRGTPT